MSRFSKINAFYGVKEPDRKDPDDGLHAERKPKSKKDKKRWCRGKVGKPHQPVVTFHPPTTEVDWACRWMCWRYGGGRVEPHADHTSGPTVIHRYRCHHVQRCTECWKILTRTVDCPDRP